MDKNIMLSCGKAVTITNSEQRWAKIYKKRENRYVIMTNFNPFAFPDFISKLDKNKTLPLILVLRAYDDADMGTLEVASEHIYEDIVTALNATLGKPRKNTIHQGKGSGQ